MLGGGCLLAAHGDDDGVVLEAFPPMRDSVLGEECRAGTEVPRMFVAVLISIELTHLAGKNNSERASGSLVGVRPVSGLTCLVCSELDLKRGLVRDSLHEVAEDPSPV